MDDTLYISIFKELAVLKGERTPEGQWVGDNAWLIQNTLTQAIKLVDRAKEDAKK
jgi:hypothetical protein